MHLICIRNFAAVEVATAAKTFYLNLARLEHTILLLKLYPPDLALRKFSEKYYQVGVPERHNYFDAAVACINHGVTP